MRTYRGALGLWALLLVSVTGCYRMVPSSGGGEANFEGYRMVLAGDVALPRGYQIRPVATKLTFPSGVTFDDQNRPYVVEAGYSYGEVFLKPRLLRVEQDGQLTEILTGENGPWTGVTFHEGAFYIAVGGEEKGGAILRYGSDGKITRLLEGLPSVGDHHVNGPAIRDGYVYFAIGAATNSGVVGTDNYDFGWLKRYPQFCDIPAKDIQLAGENYRSDNPLTADKSDTAETGAYLPFGTASKAGQVIQGRLPCTGGIMRVPVNGGPIELVAWGLRNPFGLAFSNDGQLYATDNQYDTRGSRPVWGAGDTLWKIESGRWYGWPDYHGTTAVNTDKRYKVPGGDVPKMVLAKPPGEPPRPAATLAVHGSASGIDFSRSQRFGFVGNAFIAEFGDMGPGSGKVEAPAGFDVVRVDLNSGAIERFVENKGGKHGPASLLGKAGVERPVAVRFDNTGDAMYIVDFGVLTMDGKTAKPRKQTGVLWRVTPEGK